MALSVQIHWLSTPSWFYHIKTYYKQVYCEQNSEKEVQRPGFRNKGNKAFQLCAKSVLAVTHTFVSDKTCIMGS